MNVTGYYAIGDGIELAYRWDSSSTQPDDGVDASHPGLCIQPSGVSGAGRWIAITDRSAIDTRWYGTKGDNVQDDTPYIQRAISRALFGATTYGAWDCNVVILPLGTYKTTDTIHLGYGSSSDLHHITLRGSDHKAYGHVWGSQLRPTFTDRPVVNIQGARAGAVEQIAIMGTLALTTLTHQPMSAWNAITGTNTNKQFVGIAIDAYSGSDPGTGYTNAPVGWSKNHSSEVRIKNVHVEKCSHGVAQKPSGGTNADNNGDFLIIESSRFESCKFAVSINGSQARTNRLTNSGVFNCFAAVATGVAGPLLGQEVNLVETMIEGCNWAVYHNAGDWTPSVKMVDCGGERVGGILWAANAPNCIISIDRNTFSFLDADDSAIEGRAHVDVGTCHLRLTNNHLSVDQSVTALTRRELVVRCPTSGRIEGNAGDRIFVVPPRGSSVAGQVLSILNSQQYQVTAANSGAVMQPFYNLAHVSGRTYSGQAIVPLLNTKLEADEFLSVAANNSDTVYVFRVVSVAGYSDGSVVELEQLTETTSTTPISSSAVVTFMNAGQKYALRHKPVAASVVANGVLFGAPVGFGVHAPIAAETVTGYVTITDAAGTSRKVAVVS